MRTRRDIRGAEASKPDIVRIQGFPPDLTRIQITGVSVGTTRVTLTDDRGAKESIDIVVVDPDFERLRTLLQQALPTAAVLPIQVVNERREKTIVLTGTIARQEDVEIVLQLTNGVMGVVPSQGAGSGAAPTVAPGAAPGAPRVQIVNALRVGGVMQVQLDVAVARVSRNKLRNMSFDFLETGQNHSFASTVGGAFVYPTVSSGAIAGALPTTPTIGSSIGTPNGAAANLFLGVFNPTQNFFGLLQALKTESVAKIMSKPSLVCLSGHSANFLDGGSQAVPIPAGLGQVGVQFFDFGTQLSFLPIVLGGGKIYLEVEPTISILDPANGTTINGTVVPGRDEQHVKTTVQLEDGQTYVLGGLIQHRVEATTTKVPVVGEIPFLGAAFSSKPFLKRKTSWSSS